MGKKYNGFKEASGTMEKGLNILDRLELKIKGLTSYLQSKFYRVNLKKISEYENIIIEKFYDPRLNEFTLGSVTLKETDETYATILKLINRKILQSQTILEKIDNYDGNGVKYKLTHRAWKKLNTKYKKIKK